MFGAYPGTQGLSRVPGVPSGSLEEPLARAEVSLRLGLRRDLLGGMAPPGEALRMAQRLGPAAGPLRGEGCSPRTGGTRHSGAGQAGPSSPAGQGHGPRAFGEVEGRQEGSELGGSRSRLLGGWGDSGGAGMRNAGLRVPLRPIPGLHSFIRALAPGRLKIWCPCRLLSSCELLARSPSFDHFIYSSRERGRGNHCLPLGSEAGCRLADMVRLLEWLLPAWFTDQRTASLGTLREI